MKRFILIAFWSLLVGNTSQEELIIDIEQSIMAPCCWSGTVYDHGHPQLEEEIQSMVEAGQTKKEIMDNYVKIYGERILAVPVAQGFNVMAWLAPIIIGISAVIFLVLFLRTSPQDKAQSVPGNSDEKIPFDKQIENELKQMD